MPNPEGPGSRTETVLTGAPRTPSSGGDVFDGVEMVAERFRIVERLGSGGMGEVYAAQDCELGERVALKVVSRGRGAAGSGAEALRREVSLARRVAHVNVCRIYDLFRHRMDGPEGDVYFFTMELLAGETLGERLRRNGPLAPSRVLPLVSQVADGLEAIHRAGIIHGDLTLGNVFVCPGERVVVTDFGVARRRDGAEGRPAGGTPGYAAPELYRDSVPEPSCDVYSLGALVFALLTGAPPQRLEAVTQDQQLPSEGPWRQVVGRCLRADPEERFAGAAEVREALAEGWRGADRAVSTGAPTSLGDAPVAVLGFTGSGEQEWLSTAIADLLTESLGSSRRLRVLSRDRVARAELEVGHLCAEERVGALRRNLGVRFLARGSYCVVVPKGREQDGADSWLVVEVELLDARGERLACTATATGTPDRLQALVAQLESQVLDALGFMPQGEARRAPLPMPRAGDAARLFYGGLGRLRRFDARGACELLEEASRHDADNPLIYAALSRAWSRLGERTRAARAATMALQRSATLPREQQLVIEAQSAEAREDWGKAVEIHRALRTFFPADEEIGRHLAEAQLAAGHAGDALQTVAELRRLDYGPRTQPQLDLLEAAAAGDLADYERQLTAARRAMAEGVRRGSVAVQAEGTLLAAMALHRTGCIQEAALRFEAAVAGMRRVGDRGGEARALRRWANMARSNDGLVRGRELAQRALAVADEAGDRSGVARAMVLLGVVDLVAGDLENAGRRLRRSAAICRDLGDMTGEARSLENLGLVASTSSLESGLELLERSRELFLALGRERDAAHVRRTQARALLHLGRLEEARTRLEEVLVVWRRQKARLDAVGCLLALADDRMLAGDLSGAETLLAEGLRELEGPGNTKARAEAWLSLGILRGRQDRGPQAVEALREALVALADYGSSSLIMIGKSELAGELREAGGGEEADGLAGEVVAAAQADLYGPWSLRRVGLDLPHTPGLLSVLTRVLGALPSDNRYPRAHLHLALGSVRLSRGEEKEARDELQTGLAMARDHGFGYLDLEARRLLGQLDLREGRAAARRELLRLIADAESTGHLRIARQAREALDRAG